MSTKLIMSIVVALLLMMVGLAIPTASASADKTTICHQTASGQVTIDVANASLLPAHYAHGDSEGACDTESVIDPCIYPSGTVCVCKNSCVATPSDHASDKAKGKASKFAEAISCFCNDGDIGGLYNSDGVGRFTVVAPPSESAGNTGQTFREIEGQ